MSYNYNEKAAIKLYDRFRSVEMYESGQTMAEWPEADDSVKEFWREMASLVYKTVQKENKMLRETIERAKMRGFVMVEGEALAWDFTYINERQVKCSLIVYGDTKETVERNLANAGIDPLKGLLTLAEPVAAILHADNQYTPKPKQT